MRVLVADDDPRIVRMISKVLKKENFTIDTAFDGQTAFDKAKTKKYDVIILDIMMPQKTGFDIIAGLRVLGIKTLIIVISARSMVEDRIHALNLGADDYLVKNFSLEELVVRIKSLLRRSINKSTNIVCCGDLVIDFSDMTVRRKQTHIYLSKKELDLLMALMKRSNTIISREDLIRAVWGSQGQRVSSNTLDVHIRFLRKKIDPIGNPSYIQTLRGRGYMLRKPS